LFIIPEEKEFNIDSISKAVDNFSKEPNRYFFKISGIAKRKREQHSFQQEVYIILV